MDEDDVFSSVLYFQQYFFKGTELFTGYKLLQTTLLFHYHYNLLNKLLNRVVGGYFVGFCFSEHIFGGFLLVGIYFLCRLEIPNSADPCF